jgi:hypothetical protein
LEEMVAPHLEAAEAQSEVVVPHLEAVVVALLKDTSL